MNRRGAVLTLLVWSAAAVALAQMGGSGGRRGGGRGGRGGKPSDPAATSSKSDAAPSAPQTPVTEVEIVGVIYAIDPHAERITIAYEACDAPNLPPGAAPFEVAKSAPLKDATVGEKIRFNLDSHQFSAIRPFLAVHRDMNPVAHPATTRVRAWPFWPFSSRERSLISPPW